jgi:hypothetical protein
MKRFLPVLLICLGFCAKSQNYVPLPLDSAYWQVTTSGTWASGGTCLSSFTFQYQTAGDTIIGSKIYTKILHVGPYNCMCGAGTSIYEAYLRQDTLAGKVFVIQKDSTYENILYDFTQNKGDTVNSVLIRWSYSCPSPTIVDSVDTVLISGHNRRRMHLSSPCYSAPGWCFIEGIGSTTGLLEPIFSFEAGSYLECANYSGQPIYPDSTSICNRILSHNINQKENSQIKISPNPTTGSIFVNLSEEATQIQITNSLGDIVQTYKPTSSNFNVEIKEAGVYYIHVQTNGIPLTKKIVVCR